MSSSSPSPSVALRLALVAVDALALGHGKDTRVTTFVRAVNLMHITTTTASAPVPSTMLDSALVHVHLVCSHRLRWPRALRALGGVAGLAQTLSALDDVAAVLHTTLATTTTMESAKAARDARALVAQCLYARLVRVRPEDAVASRLALALTALADTATSVRERLELRAFVERRALFASDTAASDLLALALNAHADHARTAYLRWKRRVETVLEGQVSAEHFRSRSELSADREDMRETLTRVTRLYAYLDTPTLALTFAPLCALWRLALSAALRFAVDADPLLIDYALFEVYSLAPSFLCCEFL